MMTYPLNFRKKVLKIKAEENLSFVTVAKKFGLSKTTVFKWDKKLEPQRNRNKKPIKIDMAMLMKDIEQYPDSYNYERGKRLGISKSGIHDAKKRLGVTYKKNPKSSKSGSRKKICVLPKDCAL